MCPLSLCLNFTIPLIVDSVVVGLDLVEDLHWWDGREERQSRRSSQNWLILIEVEMVIESRDQKDEAL